MVNKGYKKILIINLGGIGDLLLSTPVLRALKSFYPQSNITLMVVPRVYEATKDLPYIDEFVVFYKNFKKLGKAIALLLSLRKRRFDLAVNMRTIVSLKSAREIKLLLDIINPKLKAGRDTEGRGWFFDIKIPEQDIGEKSEMEYDIDTVERLGVEVKDKTIDFAIDTENIKKIDFLLKQEGVNDDDILIGIHPGGMPSRRWPLKNLVQVMEKIQENILCRFVITGGREEIMLAEQLLKNTNLKLINFVARLNIKELGALIKRCNLYISNDTGPMHMAAVLKTPLVAIFGPGDITRYDPRKIYSKAVVVYKKAECAPCNKKRCQDLKCLWNISVEEVANAALKILSDEDAISIFNAKGNSEK